MFTEEQLEQMAAKPRVLAREELIDWLREQASEAKDA
jgi:hypothetical protein